MKKTLERGGKTILGALTILFALTFSTSAWVRNTFLQSSLRTPSLVSMDGNSGNSQAAVHDGGSAGSIHISVNRSETGITARGMGTAPYANAGKGPFRPSLCGYRAPITDPSGYYYSCFSPNAQGSTLVAYRVAGAVPHQPMALNLNGTIDQSPFVAGGIVGRSITVLRHLAVWNNAIGNLLADSIALQNSASEATQSVRESTAKAETDAFGHNELGAGPPPETSVNLVQAETGAVARATQNKVRMNFRIGEFGAVCDGLTDDTTAVVAAITAAGTNGNIVIPSGTCIVRGITLGAVGQTLTISPGAKLKAINGISTALVSMNASHTSLRGGGSIDGNRANASGQPDCVFVRSGSANVTVQDLSISDCAFMGVRSLDAPNLRVLHNYLTAISYIAIFPGNSGATDYSNVLINGNTIDLSAEPANHTVLGILINGDALPCTHYTKNVIVSANNVILPLVPAGGVSSVAISGRCTDGSAFVGNNTSGGWANYSVDTSKNYTISGGKMIGGTFAGIELADVFNISISNIVADGQGVGGSAIFINGDALSSHITIEGMTIKNYTTGGIIAQPGHYVTVRGCTFQGYNARPFAAFAGSHHLIIANNIIEGNNVVLRGISFELTDSNPVDVAITGNIFRNIGYGPLSVYSGDSFNFSNMTFTGNSLINTNNRLFTNDGGVTFTTDIRTSGNSNITNDRFHVEYQDYGANVVNADGSSSPEGRVTANVGSTYQRSGGRAGTSFYVKESGTGNTGWVGK